MRIEVLAGFALVAALAAACTGQEQQAAQNSATVQTQALQRQSADGFLEARVATAIAADAGVNAFKVTPIARDGVVTLKGTVGTRAIAQTILSTAKAVPGVRRIVDEIAVR